MLPLSEGDLAPSFQLLDQHGTAQRLEDYRGRWVILYFDPRDEERPCCPLAAQGDNCDLCILEVLDFGAMQSEFEQRGAAIIGIARNGAAWQYRVAREHEVRFPILIDAERAVATLYSSWRERPIRGLPTMAMTRSTFIIDPEGHIRHIWPKIMPTGHVADVIEVFKALVP